MTVAHEGLAPQPLPGTALDAAFQKRAAEGLSLGLLPSRNRVRVPDVTAAVVSIPLPTQRSAPVSRVSGNRG